MATFTDVAALMPTLCGHLADGADVVDAQGQMLLLSDAEVLAVLRESADLCRQADQVRLIASGIVGFRSTRAAGHSGLAQSQGHRSPASLIQEATGSTRGEAARSLRVGEAMVGGSGGGVEGDAGANAGDEAGGSGGGFADEGSAGEGSADDGGLFGDGAGAGDFDSDPSGGADRHDSPRVHWADPLRAALRAGSISAAQFDAILRGLGEPPAPNAADGQVDADPAGTRDAWMQAARQLVDEAHERTVEELGSAARMIRDLLDPEGAERRFMARYEKRSFRTYRDQDGVRRASIAFEDEGGAFLDALIDAAMRPRRGGARFVDSDEKARAAALTDDPRTNDQLTYDLVMDVIRAGALADAASVFGTRQAGVRLVQPVGESGAPTPMAHTEDGLSAMPSACAEQRVCESGFTPVIVDGCGNPLDVGREQRLFTSKQRIGLAVRDGGCRWRGCDRPASYCEAHHIDPYGEGGRTDIDRGLLLCRFHHMNLHHGKWWISRDGKGDFVLHHPGGEQFVLQPRAALTYAWAGIDPPPRRFRTAA